MKAKTKKVTIVHAGTNQQTTIGADKFIKNYEALTKDHWYLLDGQELPEIITNFLKPESSKEAPKKKRAKKEEPTTIVDQTESNISDEEKQTTK